MAKKGEDVCSPAGSRVEAGGEGTAWLLSVAGREVPEEDCTETAEVGGGRTVAEEESWSGVRGGELGGGSGS